jgi:hypothetical protein
MAQAEQRIAVTLSTKDGDREAVLAAQRLFVMGWTARDVEAMEAHIRELEEMGIPRPARTPIMYRNAVARLTTSPCIEVSGGSTSGEVEFVIAMINGEKWVGAGSDHTDRELEKQGITVAKQICEKPIASVFWPYDEVAGHWDKLMLRSQIEEGGTMVAYQEGSVASMRPAEELVAMLAADEATGGMRDGDVMMGGTLAAKGGIRPSGRFSFELVDPVLNRRIAHSYAIMDLPIAG